MESGIPGNGYPFDGDVGGTPYTHPSYNPNAFFLFDLGVVTGDFSMILSNNHSTGGTCFGDSGGPNFIGTSNVVAGVTSFGKNGNCAGTGGVYRVDRADDLNWLYSTFGHLLR